MVTTEPQVNPNGLYGAMEASRVLGISRVTLNEYTKKGYCKAGTRKVNGRRCWKGSELIKVWRIVY